MLRALQVLLLAALTFLAGCFPVLYTDVPLGEPARLEPSHWNGVWFIGLPEKGRLVRMQLGVLGANDLAVTENWRECDMSQAGPWEDARFGEMRRYDEWYFLEACDGRLATGEPCEYGTILRNNKDVLTVHLADEARIRRLLDKGEVPGRIELLPSDGSQKQRVVLNPLSDKHYRELLSPLTGAFPVIDVLGVRLPAELDPCSKQSK